MTASVLYLTSPVRIALSNTTIYPIVLLALLVHDRKRGEQW